MNDLRKAADMALEALCLTNNEAVPDDIEERREAAIEALRQALAQPEQEPLGGEWVPCVKLPVVVHVRNQRNGETHISTREGITPVLPDDLIMRGVAGEEYPIGRELFERTYTFDVDAVNMSQERVDETAKSEHEQKTPLKVLNLTVFTENRLRNGRVYDVETLQAMTNRDILAIPDMGKKALKEVMEALNVYAVNMSQERVEETAKREHEPVAWMWKDGSLTSDPDEADGTWTKLYIAPPKREWVGLTDEDIAELRRNGAHSVSDKDFMAIEAKLKEKNT